MSDVLQLTIDLIARTSVTPDDAGCQRLIGERLQRAGFSIESLRFGEVDNLWATHGDGDGPVLVLLGHTDVVPTGPREAWASDPFAPEIRDGVLYGRGAADMKGSVAAFVVALEAFVAAHPRHAGKVALLLTSDEEGDAIDGVRKVAAVFRERGEKVSPDEVENAIYSLPAVREAVVAGIPDPLLGEAVCAFVTLREGAKLTVRQIKRACSERLENYMVPKYVLIVSELPRTLNGKLSRKSILQQYSALIVEAA